MEAEILAPFGVWREGLERLGLAQERRPMRVRLDDLQWRFPEQDVLILDFFLPAGVYATVLLREILRVDSPPVV
jgi:tRNA pseudouridine13 synthase